MKKNTTSLILVAIQLLSLFFILVTGTIIPSDPLIATLLVLGVFLTAWAFYALRTTKFSLLPEIPENAALVTAGPYRIIRHPIYTGIIVIALSLVINQPSPTRLVAFVVLAGVLLYKTELEEKYLDKHFKEYGNYKMQTQKLIPFLY
jgi:protein-S-isoprenylcysteine O-methyltransferase Ste14